MATLTKSLAIFAITLGSVSVAEAGPPTRKTFRSLRAKVRPVPATGKPVRLNRGLSGRPARFMPRPILRPILILKARGLRDGTRLVYSNGRQKVWATFQGKRIVRMFQMQNGKRVPMKFSRRSTSSPAAGGVYDHDKGICYEATIIVVVIVV